MKALEEMIKSFSDKTVLSEKLVLPFWISSVSCKFRNSFADEGERLLLVHVPVEDVQLVVGHRIDHSLQRRNRKIIPTGIDQNPSKRKYRRITNQHFVWNLEWVFFRIESDELTQSFESVTESVKGVGVDRHSDLVPNFFARQTLDGQIIFFRSF